MAQYRQRGFTLIEIVLVLAIAGLLLIVVFFAVSGAQRTRRDFQRKQDTGEMVAAVLAWRGNHMDANLDSQADLDDVGNNYLNGKDPSEGTPYVMRFYGSGAPHLAAPPPVGEMAYVTEHVCGSDVATSTLVTIDTNWVHGIRQFAVVISLENGTTYCVDHR